MLTSTSRGFDNNLEFLESWVPRSEINQSLTDLVLAAIDYDVKELEIEFSNSEIDNFSIEKVKKQLKNNIVLEVKKNILLVKVH
tara:strand:- start:15102 stop:15353 length:252 start_codon:yes stop_codon:yes gene_type:complete